jgi:hypothetical protein
LLLLQDGFQFRRLTAPGSQPASEQEVAKSLSSSSQG